MRGRSQVLSTWLLFAVALAVRHRSETDPEEAPPLVVGHEAPCSCSGLLGLACPCSESAIQLSPQRQGVTKLSRQKRRARKARRRGDPNLDPTTPGAGAVDPNVPEEQEKAEETEEDGCVEEGLTRRQNVWMQVGPLGMFVGFLLALMLYVELVEIVAPPAGTSATAAVPQGVAATIMKQLWGMGVASSAINALIIVLGLLNFYTYAVKTEEELDPSYICLGLPLDHAGKRVEVFSMIVFAKITLVRLAVVHMHPDWSHFGLTAAPRYLLCNIYMLLEVAALALTLKGLLSGKFHVDLLWLFLARSMEMLERGGAGLGVKRMKHMVTDDGKLLLVAGVFGLVVWLVMSGFYFVANRANCQIIWQNDEFKWQRFTSIPSSMWYVMINLLKEHPLAEYHETLMSRTLVCICCIFAMPLFALPSSILQCALFERDEKEDAEEVARQGEAAHTRRMTYHDDAAQLLELQADAQQHLRQGFATGALVFGSILSYFYYTALHTDHATFLMVPVVVSKTNLAFIDGAVAICFLCEYASRSSFGGGSYIVSGYGVIDLLAWLPGLLHLCTYESMDNRHHEILCAACVLRIFKLERYLHSFRDMMDIVKENGGILTATLVLSMFLWMLFSTLLFLTEKDNPDEEMNDEVYGSVMRSLWSEIINLHGEWPWADYTPMGKAVGTVIGLFSIMLFCIPIGIFGEGFMEKVRADRELSHEDDDFDRRPWQERCRPAPSMRQKVYDMLYEDLHPKIFPKPTPLFRGIRAFCVLMVVATTFITAVATIEDWGGWKGRDTTTEVGKIFWVVDVVATVWFILEYVLRIVATGWRHPASFVGLCDLISIAAFAYTLDPRTRPEAFRPGYEDVHYVVDSIVLLRLLRVFSLESYFYAMHTLQCVLWLNKWPLARAGGALVSIWFVHATLLYICENPKALGGAIPPEPGAGDAGEAAKGEDEDDGLTMAQRYRSVLSALQYSIVHLFGDYPETDYTKEAKIIHFVGIMGGIAVISTFCGVFSAGFVDFLETSRHQEVEKKNSDFLRATVKMKLCLERAVAKRRSRISSGSIAAQQAPRPLLRFARAIVFRRTSTGSWIQLFFNAALVVSLVNTMAASIPEIDRSRASSRVCLVVEAACTVIFVADYAVRLLARPRSALSFFGIIDFICCLPGIFVFYNWMSQGRPHSEKESVVEAFSMFRAVRILNFHIFQTEVRIIGRVLKDASTKLAVPGYLALNVWITTSALFMWLENEWKNEASECEAKYGADQCGGPGTYEDMPDVPSAMYWCSIFLTGEWANVDFTYAGSRLCIFYVIFGIAIFSIPVGILVEAVRGTLHMISMEEKAKQKVMSLPSTANLMPEDAPKHWKS